MAPSAAIAVRTLRPIRPRQQQQSKGVSLRNALPNATTPWLLRADNPPRPDFTGSFGAMCRCFTAQ